LPYSIGGADKNTNKDDTSVHKQLLKFDNTLDVFHAVFLSEFPVFVDA